MKKRDMKHISIIIHPASLDQHINYGMDEYHISVGDVEIIQSLTIKDFFESHIDDNWSAFKEYCKSMSQTNKP